MKLMERIRQAVYPSGVLCVLCGSLSHGSMLCDACRQRMELLTLREPLCPRCGTPMQPDRECGCELPPYLLSRSVWRYQDAAAQLVQALKFGQIRDAHEPLACGMAQLIGRLQGVEGALVTWVTMPDSRRSERSFDHAEQIARTAAALLQLDCRQLLTRHEENRALRHQVGLTAQERAINLKGSFSCREALEGTVILVDDVYTTGATTREAAACLHEAGAERVIAVTAARSIKDS